MKVRELAEEIAARCCGIPLQRVSPDIIDRVEKDLVGFAQDKGAVEEARLRHAFRAGAELAVGEDLGDAFDHYMRTLGPSTQD